MATNWLNYANQGATRSQPLSPQLVEALGFLGDLGVSMDVFSGGQPATGLARVGSHRHDNGGSADVFFSKDGRKLDWANPADVPIFQDIVRRAKAAGVTGFGAGPGYMQPGSMHIGFGTPAVWGAGGSKKTAPDWLRAAYGQAQLGNAPEVAPQAPLSPQATAFVQNNPQPGGFGPGVPDPNSPPVFGSMAPGMMADNSIDPNVAAYAFDDKEKADPWGEAGAEFSNAFSAIKPPRIAAMPSPSGDTANGLLKLMQNPGALAQLLMKKRFA